MKTSAGRIKGGKKKSKSYGLMRPALTRIIAAIAVTSTLLGCTPNIIREDSVQDNLPLIYPNEGAGRNETVTLYYKLKGEPYLVPVMETLSIRASEYSAEAIMDKLAEGPGTLLWDLESALPETAHALSVSVDNDVAYVTMSEELFGEEGWAAEDRYLSICAIVNSLTALNGISRVQLWDSMGKRLTSFQYGFETTGQQLLGTLSRQDEVVLTPMKLVERTFLRLSEEEYTLAYALFAQTEPGGFQKPSYTELEERLEAVGRINGVTVYSITDATGTTGAVAIVDIRLTDRMGNIKTIKDAVLQLAPNERYKIGLYSLMKVLEEYE